MHADAFIAPIVVLAVPTGQNEQDVAPSPACAPKGPFHAELITKGSS